MRNPFPISSYGRRSGIPVGLALWLAAFVPSQGWAHGEVAGGGEQTTVQKVAARNGTYRVEMMHSPAQPVAGEPANIELKVVRLLPKPDPLLGSEVPVGLPPEASLLPAQSDEVLDAHLPVHSEGEAGIFGVAEYRFPAGGLFLIRSLVPQTGSFRIRFLIHTEAGDQFTVELPIAVQPNTASLFRVWVNLALCGLIFGLTGMQFWKVRAAGGHAPQMIRPASIGAVSLVVVMLGMNFFVLDQVLAMRKPKVVATKAEAATRQWTAGASAKAWSIFSKQPNAKRRDALALCVKAGINLNTAKTQYQHWLHRKEAK